MQAVCLHLELTGLCVNKWLQFISHIGGSECRHPPHPPPQRVCLPTRARLPTLLSAIVQSLNVQPHCVCVCVCVCTEHTKKKLVLTLCKCCTTKTFIPPRLLSVCSHWISSRCLRLSSSAVTQTAVHLIVAL